MRAWLLIAALIGCVSWAAPVKMAAGADQVQVSATSGRSDFNGDGFGDLAVGAADAVHVFYGSASGLTTVGNQLWNQDSPGIEGVGFGGGQAAGDFNGDGFGDLAVGGDGDSGGPSGGSVNVIYGSAAGLTSVGSQLWSQNSTGIAGTAEDGDEFGSSLAAANFGNSNHDDLLVGVPGEDVGSVVDAGAIQILYGSADGLASTGNQLWTQNGTAIASFAEESDRFGCTVAAGNFGKNGYADAAVGACFEGIGELDGAGVVHVLFGSAAGLTSSGSQMWSQNSRGVPGAAEEYDSFGSTLAAANFGNNSYADLAVGVPSKMSGRYNPSSGAVIVLYGSASGLTSARSQLWIQDSPGIKGVTAVYDGFGTSLAAADLGKSTHADLAVGAPGAEEWSGEVSVIYGSAAGLTAAGDQLWTPDSPGIKGDWSIYGGFGHAVAAGNFGKSGRADLTIGSPGYIAADWEEEPARAGLLHVVYGSATGLTSAGDQLWNRDTPDILGEAANTDGFGSSLVASP
jgi:hypothetical protein